MIRTNFLTSKKLMKDWPPKTHQLILLRAEGKTLFECSQTLGVSINTCWRWSNVPEIQGEIDRLSEIGDVYLKEERVKIAKRWLRRVLSAKLPKRMDPLAILEYIAKETGGLQPEQQFVFVNIIEEASRIRERIGGSLGNPDISPELVRDISAGLRSLDKTGRDSRKRKIKQEDGS